MSSLGYKILYVLFKDYFYLKAIFAKVVFKKLALYIYIYKNYIYIYNSFII